MSAWHSEICDCEDCIDWNKGKGKWVRMRIIENCLRCGKKLGDGDNDMFTFTRNGRTIAIYLDICRVCGALFKEWMEEMKWNRD